MPTALEPFVPNTFTVTQRTVISCCVFISNANEKNRDVLYMAGKPSPTFGFQQLPSRQWCHNLLLLCLFVYSTAAGFSHCRWHHKTWTYYLSNHTRAALTSCAHLREGFTLLRLKDWVAIVSTAEICDELCRPGICRWITPMENKDVVPEAILEMENA